MSTAVVLIVDADKVQRTTLAEILENDGNEVLIAGNATEGLSLLEKNIADLVLIDLDLPDMEGFNLLSKLKISHSLSAVIVHSGNPSFDSAKEAINQGVCGYLVKPFEIDYAIPIIRSAIEKQQTTATLKRNEAKYRILLESAPDAIVVLDNNQKILMANKQFETMFGYNRLEVMGKTIDLLVPPRFVNHQNYVDTFLKDPVHRSMRQRGEYYALREDGSEFPVDISLSPLEIHGEFIISAAIRDATEYKRYEEKLKYQSNHDELTGLPNRNLLVDRVGHALHHANRNRNLMAILFIDLDQFKIINDSLGHDMGDQLLQVIAERLPSCVRAYDTVARQGGDDFVIVLSDLAKIEDAAIVAQKILSAINKPLLINEHELEVSCSIGISVYPKDGTDVQTLLKNSDAAMYLAKERGRNTFQYFTEDLNQKVTTRMTMEANLRRSLENGEILVNYQPQVNLQTGHIVGMEALLRWNSHDFGMVPPSQFIPLAEETGLIIPIGEWVLKSACLQNKIWQDAGFSPLTVAVNLSPRQFWGPGLIELVAQVLKESNLKPGYLELEITEGMVMRNVETAKNMLRELKELGVQLSIDDFGTGYSSLGQLRHFPFDKLKMDISFVREITFDPSSAAIAKTIIAMGHNLDLQVIAEGVETEGQLSYLRLHGCDEMQGFYFSKPLSTDDFDSLLREERVLCFPPKDDFHSKRTLLLIDDEPNIIRSIERMLHKEGYRILSTTDANEGFELLAINQTGVVLCDQQMPGMSGVEFLSKVKSLHPDTIRIAMSGYADLGMVTSAVNQGAIYKFLTKPVETDLLRQCVAKAFDAYEFGLV